MKMSLLPRKHRPLCGNARVLCGCGAFVVDTLRRFLNLLFDLLISFLAGRIKRREGFIDSGQRLAQMPIDKSADLGIAKQSICLL